MTTTYSPSNVDQTYHIIVYPNNVYFLTETNLENDRLRVEAMLKEIKKVALRQNTKKTFLKVYELTENEIKIKLQSPFYNIISFN